MILLRNITVDELLKIQPDNIIDIRTIEKYNDNHIPNSYNIPYNKLITNPENYLDKDKTYYIYCQRGVTSKRLCILLNKKGYNLINIIGGYEEWILKS